MREFYYNDQDYDFDKKMQDHQVKDKDRELINEYLAFKKKTDHIKDTSARRIVNNLIVFIRYSKKPIKEMTIDEVTDGIEAVKNGSTCPGPNSHIKRAPKPLEPNTIRQIVITVKGLLRWACQTKHTKITLEEIEFNIKAPEGKDETETINPEDILTEDEILLMASNALTERDRTLILLTYESGCRIGEIARAKWKDIKFETINGRDTAKFQIGDRKNNKKRYARLTLSAPNLIALKNVMKPKSEDELVFTARKKITGEVESMQHITIYHVFENVAKRAGITKPVHPHAFRHARATHMLRQGWSETIVKKQLWNNVNTPMLKTYLALGSDAIDDEAFKHAGIKKIREIVAENPPENKVCGNCNFVNNASIDYCGKCGYPLNDKALKVSQDDEKKAIETSQTLEFMQKKMAEMQAQIQALQSKK